MSNQNEKKSSLWLLNPDGFKRQTLSLILPTLFIGFLSLALPLLTLQVYDRILPSQGSGTLPVLIAGVCVAIMLETFLRLARSYSLGWSGAAYEHRVACNAINHVLKADLRVLNQDGSGEQLNRISAISKLRDFHNGYNLVTYTEISFVFLYLGVMSVIAGPLVVIPVVVLILYAMISFFCGRMLSHALRQRDEADDSCYNFVIEALKGIHTIKAFSLERPFLRRYERRQYDATTSNYKVTEATAQTFNAGTLMGHIMLVCVISYGAWLVLNEQMSSGALIAGILLSGRMMQPVQRGLGLWTRYQDYQAARARLQKIADIPVVSSQRSENPERKGALELKDIGVSGLFRNVSLNLEIGQSIQLTGAYGCGKTTLMKIMAGIYKPDEGVVRIDGVDPIDIAGESLMSHVGYIPTSGVIFRGRVRDNLTRFGTIGEEDIRPITAMLGIEQDVSRLPRGFDTWMEGSEQDSIPPGLRQRIAIARILAARPRIILFDNADRNLDRDGYRQIHTLLGRLRSRVALVLVTDDLNISRLAERRIMLTPDGLYEQGINIDSSFREIRA